MLTIDCFSNTKQSIVFMAIIFAKDALHFFEEKHPSDVLPRKAIEAAENWLNDRTPLNVGRASAAGYAISMGISSYNFDFAAHAAHAAGYYSFEFYSSAANTVAANAALIAISSTDYNSINNKEEYIHKILFKNLSIIFDFHIKERIAFYQPDVVFQYLTDEQKEQFIFEMNLLVE